MQPAERDSYLGIPAKILDKTVVKLRYKTACTSQEDKFETICHPCRYYWNAQLNCRTLKITSKMLQNFGPYSSPSPGGVAWWVSDLVEAVEEDAWPSDVGWNRMGYQLVEDNIPVKWDELTRWLKAALLRAFAPDQF